MIQCLCYCASTLSDVDTDGRLDLTEFSMAMHYLAHARNGGKLPDQVPPNLLKSLGAALIITRKGGVSTQALIISRANCFLLGSVL